MTQYIVYVLVAVTLACSSTLGQASNMVHVNGHLIVDSRVSTNDRIDLFIQHRSQDETEWQTVPLQIDSNGFFHLLVPRGSVVSASVSTTNPVLMTPETQRAGFYLLHGDASYTILHKYLTVTGRESSAVSLDLHLETGAALRLCKPSGLLSGAVKLRKKSGSNSVVFAFSNGAILEHTILGGIEPGPWLLTIENDQDDVLLRKALVLRKGEEVTLNCSAPSS